MAYLVDCLIELRYEFNQENPQRDKGADGWIGDAKHQTETSDHNPNSQGAVLALDIDSTGPFPVPFDDYIEYIVVEHRMNRMQFCEYVIWNRKIASIKSGWNWIPYTGTSDPHTGHAHFSARHDHRNNDSTTPWGLDDRMTPEQMDILVEKIQTAVWSIAWGRTNRESAGDKLINADAKADVIDGKLDTILAKLDGIQ